MRFRHAAFPSARRSAVTPRRAFGGLLACSVLVAVSIATIAPGATHGTSPRREAAGPPAGTVLAATPVDAGRQLYLQSCASCHGADGRGGPNGPSLADAGTAAWDFYLRTGRMPLAAPGAPQHRQEPVFSEQQIQALVAYGDTLGDGPAIPPAQVSGANLQRGWQLYIQNCASCHATSGGGGAIGGGFVAPGLGRSDARTVEEAMLIGPGAMPVFAWQQEDLTAVAAYVQYLREAPSPGGFDLAGTGPVAEGFVAGVFGLGALVLVARFVARNRKERSA